MTIKVNRKELLTAVEKAAVKIKDSFIINISDRKTEDKKTFATVSASDGNTQAMISFMAQAEEKKAFKVGLELLEVIKALGEFGEELTIELTDTSACIATNNASVPLALKTDGTFIKVLTPKDKDCIRIHFNKDAFVKAVRQGSFAYGDAGCVKGLVSTVALMPYTDGETNGIKFVSTDGRLATLSSVTTGDEVNEVFKNSVGKTVSIDAPALRGIANRLESEIIELFIFDKQVTIKDGNDYYTIVRYETAFPDNVMKMLEVVDYNYKAVIDVSKLRAALKVATLLEEKNNKKALIAISNIGITISSVTESNKASLDAEKVEGEVNIIVNAKHIEAALADIGSDKITIYGQGELKPLYLSAEGVRVLTAPIRKSEDN